MVYFKVSGDKIHIKTADRCYSYFCGMFSMCTLDIPIARISDERVCEICNERFINYIYKKFRLFQKYNNMEDKV